LAIMAGEVRLQNLLLEDVEDYNVYKEAQKAIHFELRRDLSLQPSIDRNHNTLSKLETCLKYWFCWLFFFASSATMLWFALGQSTILLMRQDNCEARITASTMFIDECVDAGLSSYNVSLCSKDDEDFQLFKAAQNWDYIADNSEWYKLCEDSEANQRVSWWCFIAHAVYSGCVFLFFHGSFCCDSVRCLNAHYIHGAKFPPFFSVVVALVYFINLWVFFIWLHGIVELSTDIVAIFNNLKRESIITSFRTNVYFVVQIYLCLPVIFFCGFGCCDLLYGGSVFRRIDERCFGKDWRPLRVILDSKQRFDSSTTFSTFRGPYNELVL